VFTQVDVPGAAVTLIYRINNENNIVGIAVDDLDEEEHGVIGH
jgi:hypothetical protein